VQQTRAIWLAFFRGAHARPGRGRAQLGRIAVRPEPAGLWNCFIDDPNGLPDTSGSAGIAAALALSARAGWIDSSTAIPPAERAWQGLLPHIAADGRLGGVAQSNRSGEELQRSDYRILSAMGAGLAAQLHAALIKA
jgi:rhamnogalacturonyl hydrolase YesR